MYIIGGLSGFIAGLIVAFLSKKIHLLTLGKAVFDLALVTPVICIITYQV